MELIKNISLHNKALTDSVYNCLTAYMVGIFGWQSHFREYLFPIMPSGIRMMGF